MATFAEKLFDFTQRRQAMALEQDKFAEAKRQFNVNAQLNEIQQGQNSRRLDLLDIFQQAQVKDMGEARDIQREGNQINKAAQEEAKRQAQERELYIQKQAVQSGQFMQGEGEGAASLVPVDQSTLQQEAFNQKINQVDQFAGHLKDKFGLSKKEAVAGALNFPGLIQQPNSGGAGFNAAIGNLRIGQETMSILGQVQAQALEQGKGDFDSLSMEEIGKITDEIISKNRDALNMSLRGTSIDPAASIRAAVLGQVANSRAAQDLKRAQARKAGQMDIGQALLMQELTKTNPGLAKFMGITVDDNE